MEECFFEIEAEQVFRLSERWHCCFQVVQFKLFSVYVLVQVLQIRYQSLFPIRLN